MKKIKNVLQSGGYFGKYYGAYICSVSKEIITKTIKQNTKSISCKNNVLRVSLESNYANNEARMRSREIIEKINEKLDSKRINRIIFR